MSYRRTATAVLALAMSHMCMAGIAEAQDSGSTVIMRRPLIVRKSTGPSTPELPSTNPGEEAPDPTNMCDKGANSPEAVGIYASWVLDGGRVVKDSQQCNVVSIVLHCVATYACEVDGNDLMFTADAPDSTCENFPGPVSYPPGLDPNGGLPGMPPPGPPVTELPM